MTDDFKSPAPPEPIEVPEPEPIEVPEPEPTPREQMVANARRVAERIQAMLDEEGHYIHVLVASLDEVGHGSGDFLARVRWTVKPNPE